MNITPNDGSRSPGTPPMASAGRKSRATAVADGGGTPNAQGRSGAVPTASTAGALPHAQNGDSLDYPRLGPVDHGAARISLTADPLTYERDGVVEPRPLNENRAVAAAQLLAWKHRLAQEHASVADVLVKTQANPATTQDLDRLLPVMRTEEAVAKLRAEFSARNFTR